MSQRAYLDVIEAIVDAHPHAVLGICIHVALDLQGTMMKTNNKLDRTVPWHFVS